jgi:hypothetical protein
MQKLAHSFFLLLHIGLLLLSEICTHVFFFFSSHISNTTPILLSFFHSLAEHFHALSTALHPDYNRSFSVTQCHSARRFLFSFLFHHLPGMPVPPVLFYASIVYEYTKPNVYRGSTHYYFSLSTLLSVLAPTTCPCQRVTHSSCFADRVGCAASAPALDARPRSELVGGRNTRVLSMCSPPLIILTNQLVDSPGLGLTHRPSESAHQNYHTDLSALLAR